MLWWMKRSSNSKNARNVAWQLATQKFVSSLLKGHISLWVMTIPRSGQLPSYIYLWFLVIFFTYIGYNSFMVLNLLLLKPLQILLHLTPFQLIPSSQNPQSFRHVSITWWRRRAHKHLSSMLFFQTTLEYIKIICMPPFHPYNLLCLHLS